MPAILMGKYAETHDKAWKFGLPNSDHHHQMDPVNQSYRMTILRADYSFLYIFISTVSQKKVKSS
jgi:hypothetical protein